MIPTAITSEAQPMMWGLWWQVTVRAVEQKLREIRACIQREKAEIPKVLGT